MAPRPSRAHAQCLESLPPLPLSPEHWRAICESMLLSPQQCQALELLLRGAGQKQIAMAMKISEPTLKTYLDRIAARIGVRGRMQLAMHVLGVSHKVRPPVGVLPKDDSKKRRPKR